MNLTAVLAILPLVAVAEPLGDEKPPKSFYDKVRNETTWWTGELRFRAYSDFRYWCGFRFQGKTPKRPESVVIAFYVKRNIDVNDARSDAEHSLWSTVKSITFRWKDDPKDFPCEYERKVVKDDFAAIMALRSFGEYLFVKVPIEDLRSMTDSTSILLAIGDHNEALSQ